jgi:flagellar basal body-associated protein FliL
MKRAASIVVTVLILALLIASFGCGKSSTSDGGELKILSHTMTVHEFTGGAPQSTAVVIGRAQNVGDVTINFATIAVNFYDKNKNLIATASAVKQNLQPNEIWDFNVKTVGPDAWKSVSYDIAASAK